MLLYFILFIYGRESVCTCVHLHACAWGRKGQRERDRQTPCWVQNLVGAWFQDTGIMTGRDDHNIMGFMGLGTKLLTKLWSLTSNVFNVLFLFCGIPRKHLYNQPNTTFWVFILCYLIKKNLNHTTAIFQVRRYLQ